MQENPDLWKWLIGQEQPPKDVEINPVHNLVLNFQLGFFLLVLYFSFHPYSICLLQVFMAVHEKITNNLDRHAAPETRATPGQPWVRGWDDFKKGKDSPITGNQ